MREFCIFIVILILISFVIYKDCIRMKYLKLYPINNFVRVKINKARMEANKGNLTEEEEIILTLADSNEFELMRNAYNKISIKIIKEKPEILVLYYDSYERFKDSWIKYLRKGYFTRW